MRQRRKPSRRELAELQRSDAESADLHALQGEYNALETQVEIPELHGAIAPWGDELDELTTVANEIGTGLGLQMRLHVTLAELGPKTFTARCEPTQSLIEINKTLWDTCEPWRRLIHIAHETFHAFQYEAMMRAANGTPSEDDPTERIAAWRTRTKRDLWNPALAVAYLADKATHQLGFLRMWKRYYTHPYEAEARAFADYVLRARAGTRSVVAKM